MNKVISLCFTIPISGYITIIILYFCNVDFNDTIMYIFLSSLLFGYFNVIIYVVSLFLQKFRINILLFILNLLSLILFWWDPGNLLAVYID